jgi:hypothetical protein
MNLAILIAIAAVLLLLVVLLARRSRPDTVGDFRRQIDALSSQARRSTVDQVQGFEHSVVDEPADEKSEEQENPDGS